MSPNVREAIRDRLLATGEVTAITSVIRPGRLKQGDKPPCILIKVVGSTPFEFLNVGGRLHQARVAIQAYGVSADAADDLSARIREKALHPLFKAEVSGVKIKEVSLEAGPLDDEDKPIDGSDEWMRHSRQDFLVTYSL